MGAESEEPRRHDLHRPARPLRHYSGRHRGALARRSPPNGMLRGPRMGHPGGRQGHRAAIEKSQDGNRRHRGRRPEGDHTPRSRSSPVHDRRGFGRRRRPAHEIPLPRPAPPAVAAQHDPAAQDGAGNPPLPRRGRLPRDRNPLSGQLDARRRPRLRRPQPHEPQPVLCPAPVAADPQTAADGRRLRQVFPDRALLPRRRPARRPPARVHTDRLRDVVRRAGRRAGNFRALGQAHVQGGNGHRTG